MKTTKAAVKQAAGIPVSWIRDGQCHWQGSGTFRLFRMNGPVPWLGFGDTSQRILVVNAEALVDAGDVWVRREGAGFLLERTDSPREWDEDCAGVVIASFDWLIVSVARVV